jgi:hypothetical protein
VEGRDGSRRILPGDLKKELCRLRLQLHAAHCSSINIRKSYDLYTIAFKDLVKENLTDAFLEHEHARYELTSAINEAKLDLWGMKVPSIRTISFFFRLYGLSAVIFGSLACLLFAFLIYRFSSFAILDVPLWSPFFAGLGSSAQILTGVVDDLRREGTVVRYKRVWYIVLPLLSLIFGYMAYLLFLSGLVAFNVSSQSSISSTMLVCFLTGFSTNWLIERLSGLSKGL